MSFFVTYEKDIPNRYIIKLRLPKEDIECIIDTACSTTLIPLEIAKKFGKRINHTSSVVVGGYTYSATLYMIDNVHLGNFLIPKLAVFAADYKGALETRMLLGQNVLNNFRVVLSRNIQGELEFDYRPWVVWRDRKHPCAGFFVEHGSKPAYHPDLLTEEDGGDEFGQSTQF